MGVSREHGKDRENRVVRIFDTTLRDGEQAAGINLNTGEKIQIAKQLARMKVDVIEAGFPISSPGDFDAVRTISQQVPGPIIAGLARTRDEDIRAAHDALKDAPRSRIHVFLATSPIHMEYKLKLTEDEVVASVKSGVSLARSLTEDVEYSAEDASRSNIDFLIRVYKTAVECGATTLNIPDTTGYALPTEFHNFVREIIERTAAPANVVWSVHCHNDLGLSVANSLAAIHAGVLQIECTMNGLGERAGNASLEEIVMALRTRADQFPATTQIDTTRLYPVSKLVSNLTGIIVQPNKAIVGASAFAHEAGIHQHGMLCNRATYEIMTPESVGAPGTNLVLGKHSGRHAFVDRVESLGYNLTKEQTNTAFGLFKELCDKKKDVSDGDIEALLLDRVMNVNPEQRYSLKNYAVQVGAGSMPTASITLELHGSDDLIDAAVGNGPVDAAYKAIKKMLRFEPVLKVFRIGATSDRSDALGETNVVLEYKDLSAKGRGASTDVIEASIRAYVDAVNRLYEVAAAKGVKINGESNA